MKLSILIPTIPQHAKMLAELLAHIPQHDDVEVLVNDTDYSTGTKRNHLLLASTGKYVVFVDADDWLAINYVPVIMAAIEKKPDVIGLKGIITTNGLHPKEFRISKNFDYIERDNIYYRYNNHLSPIKRDIALQIGYPDKVYGEDYKYATDLKKSGLIKTEIFIDEHLYFYRYVTKKSYS